ncbi:MAG: Acetylornithine deacetylase/Succinyl-diaminopimelate desuccinylase and related deacylases [uncultured Truepera sp.]|uniref:Acetylornithine deacetylase/Succinyl-diaminopimelate desuccinylase and related deacylases n=1 Tax=uncultured Truepera sp. TaxID=543023 RepID=A0A6J4V3M2_9DEIN|nr:MAG: Acetylornithine deacetylase/Succinyl-diaminopimelate desuccinylase and related deacylases [uncultured Truepera sp.]
MGDTKTFIEARRTQLLEELSEFLKIPSVSTATHHKDDVRRAADFLVHKLQPLGFQTQVFETARHPVVYAERSLSDSVPTVLIYGHYDVQPPEPLELWTTPPFEPTVRDGKLHARGASDDKGQVYAHIKGVEALLEQFGTLPLNVKFLIEGEEEIGSPNLGPFIEAHRDLLAADIVLISDGAMAAPETPTITYGLKGLAYVEVHVRGAAMDLHSGAFGGGAPNPINGLAKMIAALHDDVGRVAVPGFYDTVLDITPEERVVFKRAPFDERALAEELGVSTLPGEAGYTVLERLWARPTLDCNGIGGGFQGEGSKTVIASEAMAKISCRLVPNQTPQDITQKLGDYLRAIVPEGLTVEVIELHGGDGALTPLTSPAVQAAGRALAEVYGKETVFARTGGTIPVASSFQKQLGADVVFVGLGLESDRAHSPNEKFDLMNYYRGIEVSAALLEAFAIEV